MAAPSNSDRQIYRLPAPPPGDPPTSPLPKPPAKASQRLLSQPRTTPRPSEGISNVSSYGDSQALLGLPAVGGAHGGEDPGLSAADEHSYRLSDRSSVAGSLADSMMSVVGGGDGRFVGKGETSSRRVSESIHESARGADASVIPRIWTAPERASLVASPGSMSDLEIDLGEPNHDDDGLDGDWITVSETRAVADDGPVEGSRHGASMVQHPADKRFDHVFRVREKVPSGQPILVPAYSFEGGMGFPNRNALTSPSPAATAGSVSPSPPYDGPDTSPAPGGTEPAANRGKCKERANRPFHPSFLKIRHDSEDHAGYEMRPMAGPFSARGLGRRRVRMSPVGARSCSKWTRSLEPLIEKPRRAATAEDSLRSHSPLPQRIVTADGSLPERFRPDDDDDDDDDDDAIEILPAPVRRSRVSSTPGARTPGARRSAQQLSGHRIATVSPSPTTYLEAFARPVSSIRQQSTSGPPSQLDYRLRRLPRQNSSIATGTAREKKLVSRVVLLFCVLFPPLLLLFGYGALDGAMLALSKGRIERFGRGEKRFARVLGWGIAGVCILGILVGIIVTLVRR